jgi:tetratricopeptide (TPR) repeat protein
VAYRLEKPKLGPGGLQLRYTAPADDRDERRGLLTGPDGQSSLSDLARQASDGKAHAVRMLSHCERVRTLSTAGRVDEALYLARSVCRSCSHCTLGQVLLVGTLEGSGRLWEAQQEAEEAYAGFDGDEALGVLLARVYARRGKQAEAEYTLRALIRTSSGGGATGGGATGGGATGGGARSRSAVALEGMQAALAHKQEGNRHYSAGDHERAAAAYSAALEADTAGMLTPTLLANRAQARLSGERFAEALSDCDGAIALDAGSAKLHLRRAACLVALKQPGKAKHDYEAVLRLDPTNEQARAFVDRQDRDEKRKAARGEAASGFGGAFGGGRAADAGEGDEDDEAEAEEELDPYEVLGLASHEASAADVKSAYRKLALKWHPDKHTEDSAEAQAEAEEMFQRLNVANAVLTDPVKRRMYDAGGRVKDIMR